MSVRQDGKPLVLVVDDDAFSRALAASHIAKFGANVVQAENGATAYAVLMREKVSLVILDLQMPRVDGFTLLAAVRKDARLRQVPVIVVSGQDDLQTIYRAITAGATSYLVKPLNWDEFGTHVRAALGDSDKLTVEPTVRPMSA